MSSAVFGMLCLRGWAFERKCQFETARRLAGKSLDRGRVGSGETVPAASPLHRRWGPAGAPPGNGRSPSPVESDGSFCPVGHQRFSTHPAVLGLAVTTGLG